jgi:hypothetical protein
MAVKETPFIEYVLTQFYRLPALRESAILFSYRKLAILPRRVKKISILIRRFR